jgi:uncharacterized membrane protein
MKSIMEEAEKYYPLPQPEEISIREKEDAMGAYLMMFAAMGAGLPLPIINLIAAIIYYYINKSNSRFVRFHSFQSLISQVPTTLMNAFCIFWGLRIVFSDTWFLTNNFKGYVAMVIVANLIYLVAGIVGAVKARKGRFYYFIFFGKIAYQKVYAIREEKETVKVLNTPPIV